MNKLSRKIMRRVYYAFVLRLAAHPVTTHGALIAGSLVALSYFVSFPNVLANMLEIKVKEIHVFLFRSAMSTESWTLVLFALMVVVAVSLWLQLRQRNTYTVAYG